MEALALLLVIAVFIALLTPQQKPKKPSAGDDLLKGLKAAANEIFAESILNTKKDSKSKKDNPFGSAWAVMIYTILLGILLTYI